MLLHLPSSFDLTPTLIIPETQAYPLSIFQIVKPLLFHLLNSTVTTTWQCKVLLFMVLSQEVTRHMDIGN